MTIINFKVDEEKKKKIEEIVKIKGYKSVSEFIREAIEDKMILNKVVDNFIKENPPLDKDKIKIPDFIPNGKYLGIARNEIVVIGDSIKEVMEKLYSKFPQAASGIIRKGMEMPVFETLFSLFSVENTKCYNQARLDENYYPLLEIYVELNGNTKKIFGLIDTGATIIALDNSLLNNHDLTPVRRSKVFTANKIMELSIFKAKFSYNGQSYNLDFVFTELADLFGIKALIGKNFIDKFNLLLLGNEKLFCLQSLS
jgi:predicted aspartyl protease